MSLVADKECSCCHQVKGAENFEVIHKTSNAHLAGECDSCKNLNSYARHLWKKYRITLDQYNLILKSQNGVCSICGSTCQTGKNLSVDHDHVTGRVCGLLCGNCNKGIGLFKHDPKLIQAAIEYVRRTR